MVYVLAGNGQEGGLFLFLGGDLVYSSIVLAPLCGDVHKRRVYICEILEEDGCFNPDPCKACSLVPSSWNWKRVVASSWKWNSDPGLCCAWVFSPLLLEFWMLSCVVLQLTWFHLSRKESSEIKLCYYLLA